MLSQPTKPASWQAMRAKMEELGWTETEVSRRSGVPQPTVWRILNGITKSPKYENVIKVMSVLGMMDSNSIREAGPTFSRIANTEPGPDLQGRVPLISWKQAGEMDVLDLRQPGVAEAWLNTPFKHSAEAFCLRVTGISMMPEYRDGEIILIEPALKPRHDDDIVVQLDETAMFRRLHITHEGVFLVALNPDMPDRIMRMPPAAKTLGVVIGSWKRRR